jgi:hypothetical protein
MPVRLYSAGNYGPGDTPEQFNVSGKNRDYYTSVSGVGFTGTEISPAGNIVEPGNGYRYHVYLSPTTIEISGKFLEIDYLVVGGGGGAGGQRSPGPSPGSGGGGAGGMLSGSMELLSGSYPISVGSGGGGAPNNGGTGGPSGLGNISVSGGGGGGVGFWSSSDALGPPLFWAQGRNGGSGGGGGSAPVPARPLYPTPAFFGGTGNTPPTTPPQGNNGGNGGAGGGGGGGAGGSGTPAPSGTAGIGRTDIRFAAPLIAPAIPEPVRPTWTTAVGDLGTYASGGRGNLSLTPQGYLSGGGGAGGGNPGHAYTGGGGSGYGLRPSPHSDTSGGPGGSGIVIFRYLIE